MLLRNKDKGLLIEIFSSVEIPVEVWAYGSRVNGTAHEGSDLDLVIRSQNLKPIPIELYIELKKRIQESNIPIVVELFDWTRLPDNFHWNIEAQHEIVFSNIEMMAHEPEKEYKKS